MIIFLRGNSYLGISYRHLFVFRNKESANLKTTPPHDIVGESISDHLIKPENDENSILLNKIMEKSEKIMLNSTSQ